MSFLKMCVPADGVTGIKKFVLESIVGAGGKPCPPGIVGVGHRRLGRLRDAPREGGDRAAGRHAQPRSARRRSSRSELYGPPERDGHRADGPRRRRDRAPVPHRARRHAHDAQPGRRQLPVLGRAARVARTSPPTAPSTSTGTPDGRRTRSRSRSPTRTRSCKLRAGDEVTVQGHIIGIRDRTQIRIFDQGVEPPMDLSGAFLLHTAPNVRKLGAGQVREDLHRHDDERAHGALHRAARRAVRRPRDLRQGRLPRRGDRADAAPRDGLLRDRRRRGRARDDPDRGDRGGRLGGAHARVPLEVPRQGLRPAHGRHRRPRQLALPRRPGAAPTRSWRSSMHASDGIRSWTPARAGKPRERGLTHVIDKGLEPRARSRTSSTPPASTSTSSSSAGARATSRTTSRRRSRSTARSSTPVVCGGTLFEAVYAQGQDRRVQALARALPLLARRDLRRHARHPARAEARADRRLRPRLHRPLRGRLEGLGRQHRAVPVGAVDHARSSTPAPGR